MSSTCFGFLGQKYHVEKCCTANSTILLPDDQTTHTCTIFGPTRVSERGCGARIARRREKCQEQFPEKLWELGYRRAELNIYAILHHLTSSRASSSDFFRASDWLTPRRRASRLPSNSAARARLDDPAQNEKQNVPRGASIRTRGRLWKGRVHGKL